VAGARIMTREANLDAFFQELRQRPKFAAADRTDRLGVDKTKLVII
jgi:hypothetical protein